MVEGRKPRLLVLNQYYAPSVEATGNLLADLCEALVGEYDVTVVAGTAPEIPAGRAMVNGVELITRVRPLRTTGRTSAAEAANYLSYFLLSARAALRSRRPDLVLAMTDPPFLGRPRLSHRTQVPRSARRDQPGRFPRSRRRGRPADSALSRSTCSPGSFASTCAARIGWSRSGRRCGAGWRRRAHRGASAGDPELGRHAASDTATARQPVGAGARLVDRFVVMHSGTSATPRTSTRSSAPTTFLRDLDDLATDHRRLGARLQEPRSSSPRSSKPPGALHALPTPRSTRALPLSSAHRPRRRSRARARRVRRAEPHLGRPLGRASGDRAPSRKKPRRPPSCGSPSAAASSCRPDDRLASRRRDQGRVRRQVTISRTWARAGARTSSARSTGRSPSAGTASSWKTFVLAVEIVFWIAAGALVWTHAAYPVVARVLARIRPRAVAKNDGASARRRDRRGLQRGVGDRAADREPPRARLSGRQARDRRHLRRVERSHRSARRSRPACACSATRVAAR